MRRFSLLMPALLLSALTASVPAGAQTPSSPVKVTTERCGAYTVQLRENGFDDPEDRVSLIRDGKTYVTLQETAVSLMHCGDLTGDGVPEVILGQFTGGAHCCFTSSVYSLSTPPRRLLRADTAHSDGLEPVQIDGAGPKELWTGDWRFAYMYELSFADSPALPLLYAYRNGRYVDATREYPAFVLKQLADPSKDEYPTGTYLYNYAIYMLAGQTAKAEAYVKTVPEPDRAWLENYLPDIRQHLSTAGMSDWPQRAGAADDGVWAGEGGSFSAPGTRELVTAVREPGGAASVRLYRKAGEKVSASPPLLVFPRFADLPFPLGFTVRRAGGRDDFVLRDTRSGSLTMRTYRVSPTGAQELTNDPLAVAARLLGDLGNVAGHTASLYRDSVKTEAQRQTIVGRIQAAQTRARPWLALLNQPLPVGTLGAFDVQALEVSRQDEQSALVAGTLELGFTEPGQDSEYVLTTRQTVAVFLDKRDGQWTVTRWQLTPRKGAGPLGRLGD